MKNETLLLLMYERLKAETIRTVKTISNESIIINFLNTNSNKIFEIMVRSAVDEENIDYQDLNWATGNGFIRLAEEIIDQRKAYVLTIKGIWEIENKNGIIDTEKLLDFLQASFEFSVSSDPLSDKEKIILISLISLRAFSENNAMSLIDSRKCEHWRKVLEEIEIYCLDNKIISREISYDAKIGHEHPISYLMRRLNNLSKKTNEIYKSPGEKKYFLNIDDNGKANTDKLEYLWKKIIPGGTSMDDIIHIFQFVDGLSKRSFVNICDSFSFFSATWDKEIENVKYRLIQ